MLLGRLNIQAVDNYITQTISITGIETMQKRKLDTMFAGSELRSRIPRFALEARKVNQALVDLLSAIAERKKATPAQIALDWLLLVVRALS